MIGPFELLLAFIVDCVVGDPRWLPHPVRLIGMAVEKGEALMRRTFNERTGGVFLAASIVTAAFFSTYVLVVLLRSLPPLFASAVVVYLASTTLALRGLIGSVREVCQAADIEEARKRLSYIVGRDTGTLGRTDVQRAALETLAENASDGVVAPLFYLAMGGLPLAMAYKAVNTLDSMVGYKNERYRAFGWASAMLDDIFNFIPSRLTGLLMVVSVYLLSGLSLRKAGRALRVLLRDGRKHSSPNSGYPEAAMAGALGVRMGGSSTYGGVLVEKPVINAAGNEEYQDTGSYAIRITVAASALGVLASAGYLFWGHA